jgi:hypothetical protein
MNITFILILICIILVFIYVEEIFEGFEMNVPVKMIDNDSTKMIDTKKVNYPSLYTTTVDKPYEII